jgi:hypothetical protein
MSQNLSAVETKALTLLGQGFAPAMVASAIGCSESRISQLLSQDEFAESVAAARFKNLSAQTDRDARYDSLEDQLLARLEKSLGMLFDPMKIAKLLSMINVAKRRGAVAPEQIASPSSIVNLNMPTQIFQQFVTNVNNQVIKAGEQELITMQSGRMQSLLESAAGKKSDRKETNHVLSP